MIRILVIGVLFQAFGAFLLSARAQVHPDRDTLKLDWLIDRALVRNPQIQAAGQRWRAAQEREPQVTSLDDPMLSYGRWLSTPETRVGPQEDVVMLTQRIPFFGKLGLKGEMASQETGAAEQYYFAARRDVVYKVKSAYYDLYWIDQSWEILNEYQNALRRFRNVAESKYRTGTGIQANVLKADLEISTIEERKLNFLKMETGTAARLNALLNRRPSDPLRPPAQLDTATLVINDDLVMRAASEHRQDVRAAEAMIERSKAAVSLARKNYLPDFSLSATYVTIPGGRTKALDDGKDPYSIQIGINLPLWFGKLNAAVEEANANEQAWQFSFRDVKNDVAAEVTDILARLRTAEQTVSLYDRRLIPDAERTLNSAMASYQTGTLDFLSLLDSERMLLNLRLARVKELANYWQQVAALERAVGGKLP